MVKINQFCKLKKAFSIITTLALITQVVLPGALFNFNIQKVKAAVSITVNPPTTGTDWDIGDTNDITWITAVTPPDSSPDYFKLYYSEDSGSSWNSIDDNVAYSGSPQTHNWETPVINGAGESDFQIKVESYTNPSTLTGTGTSLDFTIDYGPIATLVVDAPDKLVDVYGFVIDITLTAKDQYDNVILNYDVANLEWSVVAGPGLTLAPTSGGITATWDSGITIVDIPNDLLIDASFDDGVESASSTLNFSSGVAGSDTPTWYKELILVDTPISSTEWTIGDTEGIIFRAGGETTVSYLKTYYSHDSGGSWNLINDNVTYGSQPQTHNWKIPEVQNPNQNVFKIKVESYDSGSSLLATGTSNTFTINRDSDNPPPDDYDIRPPPEDDAEAPVSKVIGILDDNGESIVIPMPKNIYNSNFSIVAEASDNLEVDFVELYWNKNASGDYKNYGRGTELSINDENYWKWEFNTQATGGDGTYYFYSTATDIAIPPNSDVIPKGWWSASAQYDASINVGAQKPKIILTSPINNEINVGIDADIKIIFDYSMDATSVEQAFRVTRTDGIGTSFEWNTNWSNLNKIVTFSHINNQNFIYDTEYQAFVDFSVAKNEHGEFLDTQSNAPNPWTFQTARSQSPNLTTSTKAANQDIVEAGNTIVYTIRLKNTDRVRANVTFIDLIPHNTIYDNYVRNATWDPDNNRIVWNGQIRGNRTRTIRFRVRVISPLLNGTIITNEARFTDGINGWISKFAETIVESPAAHILLTSPMAGEEQVSVAPDIRVVFDQSMDRALTERAFSVVKVGETRPEEPPVSWEDDWQYRKRVVIDSNQVSGVLTNFPVLISGTNPDWRHTDSGGHITQTDGGDIMFTKADGLTKLSHELEAYNPHTGELTAWIKLDSLSSLNDTEIYMYYGHDSIANQWNITGTWDGNYQMVQHMADVTTATILDSTSNNNDGVKRAANNPAEASGKIGQGQSFARSGYINCGSKAGLRSANITVEGWAKANTLHNWMGIISNMRSWGTGFSLQLGDVQRIANMVSGQYLRTSWKPNTDIWYHIVATHNASTNENILYVNGVRENSVIRPVKYNPGNETHIGVFYTRNSLSFDGIIDEIRVSNTVRSADWIKTQYNNQNSPAGFYTMWGEESLEDVGVTWTAQWGSGDRAVTFSPAYGRELSYLTEYEAYVDPAIAKTKKGAALVAGDVPNPWTFVTAKEQVPDLIASYKKPSLDIVAAGDTITYTIRLENNGDKTATTTFVDNIPFNTIYDNYVRNATWDPDNNRIVWNGDIDPNRFRTITFRVRVATPLPNGTIITNESLIDDGVNPQIIRIAETIVESPEAHILLTSPMAGEEQVSVAPDIRVVFDQPMDRALTERAFSVVKVGETRPEEPPVSWEDDWQYRKRVVIDSNQVSGVLTNFPVLISGINPDWRHTDSGGHITQTDGGDIMFTKADGLTKLSHELEAYNPHTGELTAWIKLDSLSSLSDTEIYMYYGHDSIANQWDITGTWDGNYQMVQHLADATATTILDSTSNNNDGVKRAANNPAEASGKIGQGQSFARSGYINCGSKAGLRPANITVEGWAKANTLHNWMGIISNMRSWGTGFSLQLGDVQRIANMVSGQYLRTSWKPNTDIWYHIVATHNASTNENILYVNGVRENSSIRSVTYNPGNETHIGVFYTRNSLSFDGIIDEIRVSNTVRSADWIKTQYNNQNSPAGFYTMWGEESLEDVGVTWTAQWGSGDRAVTFSPAYGRELSYLTEYEAYVDPAIAKTKKGAALVAGDVPNPWTFVTAKEQVPDLIASYKKPSLDIVAAGDTITYTIRLENNGDKTATTTFVDNIPFNTIYDNYVRNATWDPDNNRIVWNGDIDPNRFRTITFRVRVATPLPNGTIITNESLIDDGVNPQIIRIAETIVESPEAHILLTSPMAGEEQVSVAPDIRVVFDQPMDRALTERAFSVVKVGETRPEEPPVSWEDDWQYRKRVVIDSNQVSGVLTNFPVLISGINPDWRHTDSGGHITQTDGGDIMFTKADGLTKLSHELEAYNPHTGELTAWIKLDSLSSLSDTEIYMYYGHDSIANQWDITGTWDGNYQMVQHLADATATTILDSTSNNNDGVKRAANNPAEASGKIGQGQSFARSGYINCGSKAGLRPANITVEGWAKANTLHNWMGIISNMRSWGTGFSLQLGDVQRIANMVSGQYLRTSWKPNTDIWYHIVATHNASTNENILYVNGVRENSVIRPVKYNPGNETHIGVFYTRNSLSFDGIIDEIRVSNTVRSADWIKTQYNNQNSPAGFYTMWGEESLEDVGVTWTAQWGSGDRAVTFSPAYGRELSYLTEYEAYVDPAIAKTKKGAALIAGDVPNPWTFVTMKPLFENGPNLTTSIKTVDPHVSESGDILIYTINLINSGPMNANVTFIDPIPTNTTYAYYVFGGNAKYDPDLNAITWSGIIPAELSQTIQFSVKIDDLVPNGTVILNIATFDDGFNEPISRFAETVVMPKIDWETSYKEDANDNPERNPHMAYPGDTLNYTVLVENTGSTEAVNVDITDLIPWRTIYVDKSATGEWAYEEDKNQMAWSGNIGPNENKLFTFKVLIDELADLFTPPNDTIINEAVIIDSDDNFSVQSSTTIIVDGDNPDSTTPYLIDVDPAIDKTNVKLYTPITLTFSEEIYTNSIDYTVYIDTREIDISNWTIDEIGTSSIATIRPDKPLESGREYTIWIIDAVDTQGQHLVTGGPIENNTWSFTTVRPALYFIDKSPLLFKAGTVSEAVTVKLGDWDNFEEQSSIPPNYKSYSVENSEGLYIKFYTTSETGKFDVNSKGAFDGSITSIIMPQGQDTIVFYYTDSIVTPVDRNGITTPYNITVYAPWPAAGYLVYADSRPTIATADEPIKPTQDQIYFLTNPQTMPAYVLSNNITFRIRDVQGNDIQMRAGRTFSLTTNSPAGIFYLDKVQKLQLPNQDNKYWLSLSEDSIEATFYYWDSIPSIYTITIEDEGYLIAGDPINGEESPPFANNADQPITITQEWEETEEELEKIEDETGRKIGYIIVEPEDTTVLPRATRTFMAKGFDTEGQEIENLVFSWYVVGGGGTIIKNGLNHNNHTTTFTASTIPGVYYNTVLVAAFYNGDIKAATATVRIADVVDYGGPDGLPSTGPNGIQILFIGLIFISAIALAAVEHYEKTHFGKVSKKTS